MQRFKDDWNVNKEFLMYCMEVIKRMGYFRATHDPNGWYDAASELYILVGGLVNEKASEKLEGDLKEIHKTLDGNAIGFKSKIGRRFMDNKRLEGLNELHNFTMDIVSAMHRSRLILPRADKRTGIKRLEEQFNIEKEK